MNEHPFVSADDGNHLRLERNHETGLVEGVIGYSTNRRVVFILPFGRGEDDVAFYQNALNGEYLVSFNAVVAHLRDFADSPERGEKD